MLNILFVSSRTHCNKEKYEYLFIDYLCAFDFLFVNHIYNYPVLVDI